MGKLELLCKHHITLYNFIMHSEVSVLAFVVPPLSFWTKRTSLLLNCQNQTGSEYMFSDVLWNFEELMSGFEAQHPHRCAAWTRKEGSAVMRCLAPPGASGSSVFVRPWIKTTRRGFEHAAQTGHIWTQYIYI